MYELLDSLVQLFFAVWGVFGSLVAVVVPWLPLLAWIAFWLCAVNWSQLRVLLLKGGWIGVVLIGFVMVLVWWAIAPPADGFHYVLGLKLSNFVGKTVFVTFLFCIMFLCGSVQLSGAVPKCCQAFDEPQSDTEAAH